MPDYVYDPAWEQERERLAGIEALWDGGTEAVLDGVGLRAGWRCLEVGAGGGSVVEWLCARVGESGQVVATDLDTRFVERLDFPQLEARRHDITSDPLPRRRSLFSRLVLEHRGALGRARPARGSPRARGLGGHRGLRLDGLRHRAGRPALEARESRDPGLHGSHGL